jgi:hypothetical protein
MRAVEDEHEHVQQDEVPPAFLVKPVSNLWRNRILVELHKRAMSPSQFAQEFGLGLTTAARYFRELRKWGFVEIAEERRGGKRRGAVEKLYRAIRKVYFDSPSSELLPLYFREHLTEVVFEGLLPQITEALEVGTFDDRGHRSSSFSRLDRQAWNGLVGHLDEVLYWLSDLEADAAPRLAQAGEDGLPTTVSLLCFRSSTTPVQDSQSSPPSPSTPRIGPPGPHFLMSPQTAKALSEPWRNRILVELHARPMSPKQFADEFGGPELGTTARYFRQLRDWGHLEVLERRPSRSGRSVSETIYRAVRRESLYLGPWESLPSEVKSRGPGPFVGALLDQIHQAVAAGTMDADTDRHLSWKALLLDRQAYRDCRSRLVKTQAWVKQLEAESANRQEAENAQWIPTTVALMAFRSPSP